MRVQIDHDDQEGQLSPQNEIKKETVDASVHGVRLRIAVIHRSGGLVPIVFLHGFGSSKEDYADIVRYSHFAGRPFVAFDAPGCGETFCEDVSKISIQFLVETAHAVLSHFRIDRFHFVGHSMGGLTALLLAHQEPSRPLSFINIEGNIAPEDCFLSRQIVEYPADNAQVFLGKLIERTWHAPFFSHSLYAANLSHKVRAEAVRGIFQSIVELSDTGDLMKQFLSLPFPRMFMFGEQNASLSYLELLNKNGIELAEIPHSGHFPMYSNPPAMWLRIAEVLERESKRTR